MLYKLIIAGSRSFKNYQLLLFETKLFILSNGLYNKDIEIVSGTANGADKLGEKFSKHQEYKLKKFPANWEMNGKRAGMIRNEQMAIYSDYCICFWDGESKGTKNMINLCKKHNIKLKIIKI